MHLILCVCLFVTRWAIVTEMSASRSAAGVSVFEGRIYVSGGHDGLQIFNTVSKCYCCFCWSFQNISYKILKYNIVKYTNPCCFMFLPLGGVLQPSYSIMASYRSHDKQALSARHCSLGQQSVCGRRLRRFCVPQWSWSVQLSSRAVEPLSGHEHST